MKLLFATGNSKKLELMKRRLSSLKDVEVVSPKEIGINININENGTTAEENAIIKAKAYYDTTGMATIAEDSGLWIEKFSLEDQPGLNVKRIKGIENLSDEDVLKYYTSKLCDIGGESFAKYITGVAIIDETGIVHSISISEKPFLLKAKSNSLYTCAGGVLDCISYDTDLKKYFNELTEKEENNRYLRIDAETLKLFKNTFLIK